MKQKLLAVAVLSTFAAAPSAMADVTIAGTIAPAMIQTKNDTTSATVGALGGTVAGVQGFSSLSPTNASNRFSITSSEDLGDGMKAGAFVDIRGAGGGFDNFNQNSTSGLAAFRYGASVGGGWGTLELGRNFSPYTWTMILNDPHGGAVFFGPFTIMGQAGGQGLWLQGDATARHAFFRTGTGVHYTSPDISGFNFKLSYMSEGSKNATSNSDITEWGGNVNYTPADMPFYLGAAYQQRKNANGALPMAGALGGAQTGFGGSSDKVFLIGGGVKFGDLKAGLWFENVKYKTDGVTAGLSELKRNAIWIPVNYTLPTGTIGAAYLMANDLKGTNVGGTFAGDATGGKSFQLSYFHNLSKQTQPFVMFQMTDSDSKGVYAGNGLGGKATSFLVGLQHTF
jgi:predicted porin